VWGNPSGVVPSFVENAESHFKPSHKVEENGPQPPSSPQRCFRSASRSLLLEYSPRRWDARHWFRAHPVVAPLTALCCVVLSFWQYPGMRPFLHHYFVCSRFNVRQGRWISLLLSSISHSDLWHLLCNLLALRSLGPEVQAFLRERYVRGRPSVAAPHPAALWWLVVGGAASGSIGHLLFGFGGGCLGLSAVTMALLAVYARAYPHRVLHLRWAGIFPVRVPAHRWLQGVTVGSLAMTVIAIGNPQRSGGVAHSAHLGGLLFGCFFHACIVNSHSFRDWSWASRWIRKCIAGK
jgi:membrane associated rhomboid family serine protease